MSFLTAIKNNSLSPWQQRFAQCCQTDVQLRLSSVLTRCPIGGASRIIVSNEHGDRLRMCKWMPPFKLALWCTGLFLVTRVSGNFLLLLISVWEPDQKAPFVLHETSLILEIFPRKWFLPCLERERRSYQDKNVRVSGRDTWWQSHVWGQHEVVEISR